MAVLDSVHDWDTENVSLGWVRTIRPTWSKINSIGLQKKEMFQRVEVNYGMQSTANAFWDTSDQFSALRYPQRNLVRQVTEFSLNQPAEGIVVSPSCALYPSATGSPKRVSYSHL
jgi:hypothetical protein